MINIIYSIVLFNILIIMFKLFKRYQVNNLPALIVNYLFAAMLSLSYIEQDVTIGYITNSAWIYHAITIGSLFIIIFYFFAYGIQQIGISTSTIANKMSVIIPVAISMIFYVNDTVTIMKITAFGLAIIGIYLAVEKSSSIQINRKNIWIILFIFLAQGIADAIFSDFEQKYQSKETYLFYTTLFITASMLGILILLFTSIRSCRHINYKDILWGILFGLPNFFSLVFFIKALEEIENSVVFTLTSTGIVITSSLLGWMIFGEHINKRNWAGILICTLSIYLFY